MRADDLAAEVVLVEGSQFADECFFEGDDSCRFVVVMVSEPLLDDDDFDTYLELLFLSDPDNRIDLSDLEGRPVFLDAEFSSTEGAVFAVFETEIPFSEGEETTISVNVDEALAFIGDDLDAASSARFDLQSRLMGSLGLLALAFRSRRAAKWVRQDRHDQHDEHNEQVALTGPPDPGSAVE